MSEALRDTLRTIHEENPIKTKGRKIAEYLSKKSWYCSENVTTKHSENVESTTSVEKPNLDDGWNYYEYVTLPRCFKDEDGEFSYTQTEPGETEKETIFYPLIRTPVKDLADFGVGVGMYFNALKSFAFILLLAGLISIANITYFHSDGFTGNDHLASDSKYSAICTDTSFELCPNCTESDWDSHVLRDKTRYGTTKKVDGSQLKFIKVNNCTLSNTFGIMCYISMAFVFISITIYIFRNKMKAVAYDVAQQTATDYSIMISNPPEDAKDPEKWKLFFETNFKDVHVELCTIAVNNEDLIYALIKRRKLLQKLNDKLELGVSFNEDTVLDQLPDESSYFKLMLFNKTKIYKSVKRLEEEIKELSEKTFDVNTVFITFDTEQDQRQVFEKMTTSRYNTKNLDERYLFEGIDGKKTVLEISEPDEPSSIRWNDLGHSQKHRILLQTMTFTIFLAILAGVIVLITFTMRRRGGTVAAVVIAALNSSAPFVVKLLTKRESHPNETSLTTSMYVKMTLLRWTTTTVAAIIFTPSTEIISTQVPAVYKLFLAEIVKKPILQYLDIVGNFKRHYLAPRALDQRRMNLCFQGSHYDLSDKYTNLTNILLLTFFYCTIYPFSFFFASLAMVISFVMDKFCLLRCWKRGPMIGSNISTFSNMYFLPLCLMAYAIIASAYYFGYPLDKACKSTELVSDVHTGGYNITTLDDKSHAVKIKSDDHYFEFCGQKQLWHGFPDLPRMQPEGLEWMTGSQEEFSRMFGWTSIAVLCVVSVIILHNSIGQYLIFLFCRKFKPDGEATEIQFGKVANINGYIPQVKIRGFGLPFLICDVHDIKEGLIGWKDPMGTYDQHNMIFDVQTILEIEREELAANAKEVVSIGGNSETVSFHESTLKIDLCVSYLFSSVKSWEVPDKFGWGKNISGIF